MILFISPDIAKEALAIAAVMSLLIGWVLRSSSKSYRSLAGGSKELATAIAELDTSLAEKIQRNGSIHLGDHYVKGYRVNITRRGDKRYWVEIRDNNISFHASDLPKTKSALYYAQQKTQDSKRYQSKGKKEK